MRTGQPAHGTESNFERNASEGLPNVERLTLAVVGTEVVGGEHSIGGHPSGEQAARKGDPYDDPDARGIGEIEEPLHGPLTEHVVDDLDRLYAGKLDGLHRLLDPFDADAVVPDSSLPLDTVERLEKLRSSP